MGLDIVVKSEKRTLSDALRRLLVDGDEIEIMMLDGRLVSAETTLPVSWQDVRLKTKAGTVTLTRRADTIAVVVFGNASPELLEMQKKIAAMIEGAVDSSQ